MTAADGPNAVPAGSLAGRVAIITGGTEGLGRGIASAFLREGALVAVTGRSDAKGKQLLDELEAGERLAFIRSDATDRDDAAAAIDEAARQFGTVDVLVNNVGGSGGFAKVHELSDEAWDQALALNLNSAFWSTRRALPLMLAAGRGRIINMSSVEGKQATMAAIAHYVTAKHALHGFTKAVAFEYGHQGITCNALCPGAVPTSSKPTGRAAAAAAGMTYEQFVNHFVEVTRTGRLNTVDEVAAVALLLAGDLGAGITGVMWSIDGGAASW